MTDIETKSKSKYYISQCYISQNELLPLTDNTDNYQQTVIDSDTNL